MGWPSSGGMWSLPRGPQGGPRVQEQRPGIPSNHAALQAAPAALALVQSRMRPARLPSASSVPRPGLSAFCLPVSLPSSFLSLCLLSLAPAFAAAVPALCPPSLSHHLCRCPLVPLSRLPGLSLRLRSPVPVVSPFPPFSPSRALCRYRLLLLSALTLLSLLPPCSVALILCGPAAEGALPEVT